VGRADVVTDHIDAFTESGIQLRSGARLSADVIVTATGLNLLPLGGIGLTVDGEPVFVSRLLRFMAERGTRASPSARQPGWRGLR
jgi:monooxygenase